MPPKPGDARQPALFTPAFLTILALQSTFGFAFSIFLIFPKYLVVELSATPSQVGQISAIPAAFAVLCVPIVGQLIDGSGRRRLMVWGALAMAAASMLLLFVDRVGPLVYVLRAMQGAAFILFSNTAGTLAADLAPPARLGQALGFVGLAMLVTNAAAPALAEPLAQAYGWGSVFYVAAGCSAMAAAAAFFVRDAATAQRTAGGMRELLHGPALAVLCVAASVGQGFGAVFTFTQPLALSVGMPEVRGLFIGYTISATLVRVGLGQMADRIGRRRVSFGALVLYTIVVTAAAALQRGWLVPLGAALGVAHGLLYPALNALAIEHAPAARRGSMMTLFSGAFSAGFAVCMVVFGALAEVSSYRTVFVVSGVLTALSLIALARVPTHAPA
jgi:MFS family permease